MRQSFRQTTSACCALVLALLVSVSLAKPLAPSPVIGLAPRQTIIPGGSPCGQNTATNRACWKNNWTVKTDYEVTNPPAFNTKTYEFRITNVTNWLGPDGVRKPAMLINGQFPGPTIEADWGDYIQVTVYNDLKDNGTSIHWHGIRQFGESNQDGANGVTECPIPPGSSKIYDFHVTQYGTSWYHSHYSNQYGNGVVGSLIVHGPASADYDIDLGPYMMNDYYYETADRLTLKAELSANGGPPDSDNIVFRGKAKAPTGSGGSYDRLVLTPGKKHLVRLINASVDNSLTVSLVGHNFTVIATDLVPITPVVRSSLFLGVGQRYDVIVEANQAVGNYWFNVTLETGNACGRTRNPYPAAIFSYSGASTTALPTNRGTPLVATCVGEKGFRPIVTRSLSASQFAPSTLPVSLAFHDTPRGQVFEWRVRNTPINVEWDHPVLEYILQGNTTFPAAINLVEVAGADKWVFWVIQNDLNLPHPIHLHGHDFLTLGIGSGTFNAATMMGQLDFNNPTRRDVVQMPGAGWLVIAYKTDNPGIWLMHCHIGWHVAGGLGIQFLERKAEIKAMMKLDQMQPNCNAWRKYQPTSPYLPKLDSGLKRSLNPGQMEAEEYESTVRRLW
ncbi:multicopper oxidase-domain-containing protein [Lasiosphaeris hirsuta]|uniref:laccase n=1 Tax=Lasiosphaeris hirsuta TaxID=260670 RepID=A0AA40DQG7_9PEZI|nr:multicopper oxidase-domain-containing protein [Lasiosphaeris hirsuta]